MCSGVRGVCEGGVVEGVEHEPHRGHAATHSLGRWLDATGRQRKRLAPLPEFEVLQKVTGQPCADAPTGRQ